MTAIAVVLLVGVAGLGVPQQPPPSTSQPSGSQPSGSQPSGSSPLAEAYYLFIQGRTLEGTGNVDGAMAAYKRALELAPKSAEIHAELAGLHARQGKAPEALAEAQAAVAIEPANREANRIYGLVQANLASRTSDPVQQKSIQLQAIEHLEKALVGGVRDPLSELTLGRMYVASELFQKGVDRLALFLLDQPGYPEALVLIGTAYDELGRTADAIDAVEQIVDAQPTQLQAKIWLGQLYEKAGRWKDAAELWADLAGRGVRNAPAYKARQASALVNAGDLTGGRQQLLDLTTQAPKDISIWYLLADVERRSGRAAEAEAAARKIIEIDAADARGIIAMAGAQMVKGDVRSAIATLEPRVKAAEAGDITAGLYSRMAVDLFTALDKSGERPRAIKVLEDARVKDPKSEAIRFALAGAYEKDKQFDRAEQLVRALVTEEPSNAAALNYLGYMLADRGQKLPEALTLIQRAVELEGESPSYLDSLGWVFVKQARLDLARDPLERAAAAMPKSSLVQDHLGECYFQLKRYKDAQAAWDRALDGDRDNIDVAAITKKRDRARDLAGRD